MLRTVRTVVRLTPSFIIPLTGRLNENDHDVINKDEHNNPENGWDRVKNMYTRNEYDEVSIELTNVLQSSLCGGFFGACLGGFVQSRNAYLYFIENNQATIFKTTMQAKKKLQDYVLVAFARGAYHWGWRLGTFTGFYSLIATTISVYRGDTSLVDFITAGAITGGLYKINLGLAATFVGAGLGAVLSTIAGGAIVIILKSTGISMNDIRVAMHKLREARVDQYNQAVEKAAKEKNDQLTDHHKLLVEQRGEKTVEEIVGAVN